jgi:hypothetical protein
MRSIERTLRVVVAGIGFLGAFGCAQSPPPHYPVVNDMAPKPLPERPAHAYFDGSLYREQGISDLASDRSAAFKGDAVGIRIPPKNGLPGFPQGQDTIVEGVVIRRSGSKDLLVFARRTIRLKGELKRWVIEGRVRSADIGYDNTVPIDRLAMGRYRYDHETPGKSERLSGRVKPLVSENVSANGNVPGIGAQKPVSAAANPPAAPKTLASAQGATPGAPK